MWYKNEKDSNPTGYCHLQDCLFDDEAAGANDNSTFNIKSPGRGKEYILQADDARERAAWMRALRHNAVLPPMAGLPGNNASSRTCRLPA